MRPSSTSTRSTGISLGLQVTQNPWDRIEDLFEVGKVVEGKIKNFTQFGAFVELEHGIEGLIHISDLSWTKRVNHPSELLQENESVRVQILSVDRANKRVALGLKTQENP
jgi:small subunit ribosomal protein S1